MTNHTRKAIRTRTTAILIGALAATVSTFGPVAFAAVGDSLNNAVVTTTDAPQLATAAAAAPLLAVSN